MDCSILTSCVAGSATAGLVGLLDFVAMATSWVAPLAQASSGTTEDSGVTGQQWLVLLIAMAVLVVPFLLGGFLAKALKMPNYGTRLGFVLLAVIASAAVLASKRPGLGVDLRGGTILVYEIDPSKNSGGPDGQGVIKADDLVEPLTRRINPSGTQEIVIRPYGDTQIEIIVPAVDQREVSRIKDVVEDAGILRFAIVANQADHQAVIDLALEQAAKPNLGDRMQEVIGRTDDDVLYGRWVEIGRDSDETRGVRRLRVEPLGTLLRNGLTGEIINLPNEAISDEPLASVARWIDSNGIDSLQMLTIIDPLLDIVGSDLAYAYSTFDQQGAPAVAFNLTDLGSGRFRALTTQNAPSGTRKRQLGIVLDDVLLSAPSINEPIAKEGRITGNFTREEVDRLVAILKAGQLPAALTPQPIAENQIGATLGADTIRKGVIAIAVSLALVLLFILFYYRFAGVLACLALTLNLAMILGTMVLINQPLTLPGLAGLVLTVGMSVDANVLIFERIREELKKGAKPRMAIRNGFSKATTTIVDANLTTLITAIVLYAIGTDQIRGFAVTLILGIAYSMFTAIFMSRTLFDIAERHGFVSLSMADTINSLKNAVSGGAQFDFIGKGKFSLAVSLLLVMAGVGALFARGQGILDIDFAGGASVQFRLTEKTDTETVREIVKKALTSEDGEPVQSTVTSVSMESAPDGTVYKADASIEDVERMKELLETGFAADGELKLMTYEVSVEPTPPPGNAQVPSFDDALLGGQRPNDGRQFAVAYAQEDAAEGEADSTSPAAGESTETNSDVDAGAGEESSLEESGAVLTAGQTTTSYIRLGVAGTDEVSTINAKTLIAYVRAAAEAVGVSVSDRSITLSPIGEGADKWERKSSLQFSQWQIDLPLEKEVADKVTEQLQSTLSSDAVWISSSRVGSQVASDMVGRAMGALFGSILCIIAYIWFRFQRVIYGFAAVAALLHDVLITLGAIAVSFYVADVLGFLLIDRFKISLTVVAALLTIIGYSLNDTIVVFDRIRETKGKAPRLTAEMINSSINQTLSRTLLTSITTLIVVLLLYLFGGSGIHAFAFALVIGVLVGTYSSIFVASPILLWLVKRNETASN